MTDAAWHQSNFLGGEWASSAQGRVDLPEYRMALALCSNGIPAEQGFWTRRPGWCYAGPTRKGKISRIFSYRFSQHSPTFQAEISFDGTNSWLRYWSGPELLTDGSKTVAGVSGSAPANINVVGHGWSSLDEVVFYCPQTGNANNGGILLGRVFTITKIDNDNFTIADQVSGATFAASAINLDGGVTNKVARVYRYQLPYTAASDLTNIRVVVPQAGSANTVNSGGVLLLLHPSYAPVWAYETAAPTYPAFPTMTAATATFTDGPYATSSLGVITLSAATGSVTLTLASGNLANGNNGWTASDIGNPVRIYTEPAQWASGTSYVTGDVVTLGTYPNSAFYVALSANSASSPDKYSRLWTPITGLNLWTYGTITARSSSTVVTLRIDGPDVYNTANIVLWQESLFSSYFGYPTCGLADEGRLWLCSPIASAFAASKANSYFTFSPSNYKGVVADDNGFVYQIPCSQTAANPPFRWILSDPKGIIIGLFDAEYILAPGSDGSAFSPTNLKLKKLSKYGSANYDAIDLGPARAFIQRSGGQIIEYLTDSFSGKFTGRVLNLRAPHLSSAFLRVETTRTPTPVVWSYDSTGSLFGCTYRRYGSTVTDNPEVWGWHKHTFSPSGWLVQDISTGLTSTPSGRDDRDNLYVELYSGTYYYMGYLDDAFDVDNRTSSTANYLDGNPGRGWTFGTSTTIRQLSVRDPACDSGSAGLKIYGLYHLTGKSVYANIAGLQVGPYTVDSSGTITVAYGADSEGLLTTTYLHNQSGTASTMYNMAAQVDIFRGGVQERVIVPVIVGAAYTSAGQCVRPNDPQGVHAKQGPGLGEKRRVYQFSALLKTTGACSFGTSSTGTYPAQLSSYVGGTVSGASTMFSGVHWDTLKDTSSFDGQLYWSATGVYPMNLMSVTGFLETEERGDG